MGWFETTQDTEALECSEDEFADRDEEVWAVFFGLQRECVRVEARHVLSGEQDVLEKACLLEQDVLEEARVLEEACM